MQQKKTQTFRLATLTTLIASLAGASPACAGDFKTSVDRPTSQAAKVDTAIAGFRATAPGQWRVRRDGVTGLVRTMYGGGTRPYGASPDAAALGFAAEHGELFGLGDPSATVDVVEIAPRGTGDERVILQQRYQGIEIVDGRMVVVVDGLGSVRYVSSKTQAIDLDENELAPTIGANAAIATAQQFDASRGATNARLAIWPEGRGRLVWLIGQMNTNGTPRPWTAAIDAHDGTVASARSLELHADTKADGRAAAEISLDAVAARHERAAELPPLPAGPASTDPCDREWMIFSPVGETTVSELGLPDDPYKVDIDVGVGSFGASFDDPQAAAMYAAGITLLPCYDYTITIDWALHTWDSYGGAEGFWDGFFVNVSPIGFLWDEATPDPLADRDCDTALEFPGSPIAGPLWTFGSGSFLDEALCSSFGSTSFVVSEPFHEEMLYLSVGLDTAITGASDAERPSWGSFTITITAITKVFDPNPRVATGDPFLSDEGDSNGAIPCPAYTPAALTLFPPTLPMDPFELIGLWAHMIDMAIPPECAGYTELSVEPPTSLDGEFPYLRDCDAFEAVNIYKHIYDSQTNIQALGYTTVNARAIMCDAHSFEEYNAFYCPDGAGTGELYFGDGGGDVDSGEDAEVILHEYAHSIQDNQAPDAWSFSGDNNCFGNETRAWGEGFSDAWALLHFFGTKESLGSDPFAFGTWFGPIEGLRNAANEKEFPIDMEGAIHTDGEIVSAAIMDLFMMIREDMGGAIPPARAMTETLLLDGNFLVPPSPDFADAAEAILAGDIMSGGLNAPLIGGVFTARGFFEFVDIFAFVDGVPTDDVDIAVAPLDLFTTGDGLTPFARAYGWGEDIVLTAPADVDGVPFSHWEVDGAPQKPGETTVAFAMRTIHTAEAIYMPVGITAGSTDLTQMTSDDTEFNLAPVCTDIDGSIPFAYARTYDLGVGATAGLGFKVRTVDLKIEENTGRSIDTEVRVYLDTDGGAPVGAGVDLTLLGTADLFVPGFITHTMLTATFDPPIEVAAGSVVVVEFAVPDHCHATLFPGCNELGESTPTYIRAFGCGVETFVPLADIGFPDSAFVQHLKGDIVLIGDIDGDGDVDFADLVSLLASWGACDGCPADLNGDGSVGFADLVMLLANWTG